jgi:hypothetical protein
MIKINFITTIVIFLTSCMQEGSPFYAAPIKPGYVAESWTEPRENGVLLFAEPEYKHNFMPPTVNGAIFVNDNWVDGNIDPARKFYYNFDVNNDTSSVLKIGMYIKEGAISLTGSNAYPQREWCTSDRCQPLEDALKNPELFSCYGKSYDGPNRKVSCWQDNLTLNVHLTASPMTDKIEKRFIHEFPDEQAGAAIRDVYWDSAQGFWIGTSSYTITKDGERENPPACIGGTINIDLYYEIIEHRYTSETVQVSVDSYKLIEIDDVEPALYSVHTNSYQNLCLGGYWKYDKEMKRRVRFDAWPLKHCNRVWTIADLPGPQEYEKCIIPDDPCYCASKYPTKHVCFNFADKLMCSTPQ